MKKIKLNLVAENFIGEANGVYTAFLEAVDNLKKEKDIDLSVNDDSGNCDVIHTHSIGVKCMWLSFLYNRKLIISAHVVPDSFTGSLIFSSLWKPLARWYLKFIYNRARMVIAVSPLVKSELEKIGVNSEIQVLCNSVDRTKFKKDRDLRKRFRKKFKLSDSDFIALCVGQIQPRKGIYDFLETARNLPDIKFVWVGGRPFGRLTADYDNMTKAVDEASDNTIFPGIVDFQDMPGIYAAADIYFMPSYQENFAFATIEASSLKLPLVLRDNVEYPSSLFTHYLKGRNANDFTDCIKKLYSDKTYLSNWQNESDILASKYEISAYMEKLKYYYWQVAVESNPLLKKES
ncbi:MAG: glycosyltransferase family 4 protein [bacterium]|nr:glycosyltransferase family 4 protein [bacterium]